MSVFMRVTMLIDLVLVVLVVGIVLMRMLHIPMFVRMGVMSMAIVFLVFVLLVIHVVFVCVFHSPMLVRMSVMLMLLFRHTLFQFLFILILCSKDTAQMNRQSFSKSLQPRAREQLHI
jgi:hypothetical protein